MKRPRIDNEITLQDVLTAPWHDLVLSIMDVPTQVLVDAVHKLEKDDERYKTCAGELQARNFTPGVARPVPSRKAVA
jgi:hypothetical protein